MTDLALSEKNLVQEITPVKENKPKAIGKSNRRQKKRRPRVNGSTEIGGDSNTQTSKSSKSNDPVSDLTNSASNLDISSKNRAVVAKNGDKNAIVTEDNKPAKELKPPFTIDRNYIDGCLNMVKDFKTLFLSLDVEQFELDSSIVTEIGVSIYYPPRSVISKQDPTIEYSQGLFPDIRASHIIVEEAKRYHNGRFVPDNKRNFSYGTSCCLCKKECISLLERIFRGDTCAQEKDENTKEKPKVVFVGHNVKGDITILKRFGVTFPPNHKILDTETLWRHTRREGPGSLESLLLLFRIPYQFLHNAGV